MILLKNFIIRNYSRVSRFVRQIFCNSVSYKIKEFELTLPASHRLPSYFEDYPKYDRFLPHLAKYIEGDAVIVDVGANVGDTVAFMFLSNANPIYLCIEPDAVFYRYLQHNIRKLKQFQKQAKIYSICSLVGRNITGVELIGKNGTKHAVISHSGGLKSKTLDEILKDRTDWECVRLIKSDVDGFDYDVIDSSIETIKKHSPILYFECHYFNNEQKESFLKTINHLISLGYSKWTLFDNFGGVMVTTSEIDIIEQLVEYVYLQNIHKSTRTIYYFDIMATTSADINLIENVLESYKQLY